MRSDDYVDIEATMKARTAKAVLLAAGSGEGWVPRSCLHGADDRAIDGMDIGDERTFRIREWVAEREGLI